MNVFLFLFSLFTIVTAKNVQRNRRITITNNNIGGSGGGIRITNNDVFADGSASSSVFSSNGVAPPVATQFIIHPARSRDLTISNNNINGVGNTVITNTNVGGATSISTSNFNSGQTIVSTNNVVVSAGGGGAGTSITNTNIQGSNKVYQGGMGKGFIV